MNSLNLNIYASKGTPTHSIIWMHGLGASSHDFDAIVPYLSLNKQTRIVFPQAPDLNITVNGGYSMPAWYDIYDANIKKTDHQGILKSAENLNLIFQNECALGISPENILWVGFSQGGLLALHMGLTVKSAGTIALSAYYPEDLVIPKAAGDAAKFLQIHGKQDPVVPYNLATQTQERLLNSGYKTELHTLNMEHTINLEAVELIKSHLESLGF